MLLRKKYRLGGLEGDTSAIFCFFLLGEISGIGIEDLAYLMRFKCELMW
jgi:hypothetical protein